MASTALRKKTPFPSQAHTPESSGPCSSLSQCSPCVSNHGTDVPWPQILPVLDSWLCNVILKLLPWKDEEMTSVCLPHGSDLTLWLILTQGMQQGQCCFSSESRKQEVKCASASTSGLLSNPHNATHWRMRDCVEERGATTAKTMQDPEASSQPSSWALIHQWA